MYREKCKCGKEYDETLRVDVTRKVDKKIAYDVESKHCIDCNIYAIDVEALTYE